MGAAVLVCPVTPATSCWSFQCFVVSSDVVLGGSGPEGTRLHAEAPGYLTAKPEICCAPAHAS